MYALQYNREGFSVRITKDDKPITLWLQLPSDDTSWKWWADALADDQNRTYVDSLEELIANANKGLLDQ
jgi:hypothetical protein